MLKRKKTQKKSSEKCFKNKRRTENYTNCKTRAKIFFFRFLLDNVSC